MSRYRKIAKHILDEHVETFRKLGSHDMSSRNSNVQKIPKRPMLAVGMTLEEFHGRFNAHEFIAQPKYDGVRCLISGGVAYSRSLKHIPNTNVQEMARLINIPPSITLDGELVTRDMQGTFEKVTSAVMSTHSDISLSYVIFDAFSDEDVPFINRYFRLHGMLHTSSYAAEEINTILAPIQTIDENVTPEFMLENMLINGHEGTILRHKLSFYKHGRSSITEGECIKIKPHQDAEGVLVALIEQETNTNAPVKNALGLTERSSRKVGRVKTGKLGTMEVEWEGKRFRIGTGFTAEQRQNLWTSPPPIGSLIKFRFQELTNTGKVPRFPVYLGIRHEEDM